jgi:hypothetical protein
MDAGTAVYVSDTTTEPQTIKGADCNHTDKKNAVGITVGTVDAIGQIVGVQTQGIVAMGNIFTTGDDVCLANTAGKLILRGSLDPGDTIVRMGTASGTTNLTLGILNTSIVVPTP